MAVSITIDERYVQGSKFVRNGSGNLGTYATNGVTVAASNFELPVRLDHLELNPAAGLVFEWDKTNGKVKAYRQKDPANAGGADIALTEVATAFDLSAAIFRFVATGK